MISFFIESFNMPISLSTNKGYPLPGAVSGDSQILDIQAVKAALISIDQELTTPSTNPVGEVLFELVSPLGDSVPVPAADHWYLFMGNDGVLYCKRPDGTVGAMASAPLTVVESITKRFWRVLGVGASIITDMGQGMFQADEIEFFGTETLTGTNFCLGSATISSGTSQGSATYANDGIKSISNSTNYWASASTLGQYWGCDFGVARAVKSLRYYPRAPYGKYAPSTAKLQASDDGINWLDVGSVFDLGMNSNTYVREVQNIQQ